MSEIICPYIKNFGLNELTEKSCPFEEVDNSEVDSKAWKASKKKQNKITTQYFWAIANIAPQNSMCGPCHVSSNQWQHAPLSHLLYMLAAHFWTKMTSFWPKTVDSPPITTHKHHSEHCHLSTSPAHLFEVWIFLFQGKFREFSSHLLPKRDKRCGQDGEEGTRGVVGCSLLAGEWAW